MGVQQQKREIDITVCLGEFSSMSQFDGTPCCYDLQKPSISMVSLRRFVRKSNLSYQCSFLFEEIISGIRKM